MSRPPQRGDSTGPSNIYCTAGILIAVGDFLSSSWPSLVHRRPLFCMTITCTLMHVASFCSISETANYFTPLISYSCRLFGEFFPTVGSHTFPFHHRSECRALPNLHQITYSQQISFLFLHVKHCAEICTSESHSRIFYFFFCQEAEFHALDHVLISNNCHKGAVFYNYLIKWTGSSSSDGSSFFFDVDWCCSEMSLIPPPTSTPNSHKDHFPLRPSCWEETVSCIVFLLD